MRIGLMLMACGLLLMSCKKDSPSPEKTPNDQTDPNKNDSGNTGGNNPGGNTGNNPGGNTGNNPGGNTGNNPGGNTGNNPGGNTGNNPGGNTDNPGGNTGDNPGGNTDNPGGNTDNPGGTDTPDTKTFVVKYDVDGGIVDGDASQNVKDGESVKLSAGPKVDKPDYRFDGWKDAAGKSYKAGESIVVKADITLQAIWTFEPKLIFDGNGYSGKVPDAFKFVDGLATVPSASLAWDGYDFLGWSLDRDSRSADYKAGDKVQTNNKSVTLYAVWKSQKYVYTFLSHYGSTFKTEQPFSAKDIANGVAVFDIMLTGDYEGYSHVGWRDVDSKKEYKLTDVFDELKARTFEPILINKSGAQMESWIINKY
ncbi:MAG: InlB B-repeat-containing protein [Bacteroidales bacterium]|nr:InlB B-repeat-containing protein [Bacteroidales bacterium]